MQTFRYTGPTMSSFTLPPETEAGPTRDVLLYVGKTVELPPENEYVQSLVAQGYLVAVEPEPKPPVASRNKKTAIAEGDQ